MAHRHETDGDGSQLAHGRVALVTGGARRVGRVICETLHARGYKVAVHYNTSEDLARTLAHSLNSLRQDSAHIFQYDLGGPGDAQTQTKELVQGVVDRWGRLDLLVNNAAQFYETPIDTVNLQQYDKLMDINVKTPFFLIQAAAPWLRRDGGCVVNIADVTGERSNPLGVFSVYCMTKAALIMATKALAVDLGPQVRVNYVSPGVAQWPEHLCDDSPYKKDWLARTPLGRAGTGEEVAEAVAFLASPAAAYITGTGINTCGGRSAVF